MLATDTGLSIQKSPPQPAGAALPLSVLSGHRARPYRARETVGIDGLAEIFFAGSDEPRARLVALHTGIEACIVGPTKQLGAGNCSHRATAEDPTPGFRHR